MDNTVALLSLLSLVAVIFLALKRKINCGILGVAFAFLIGFLVVVKSGSITTVASSPLMKGAPIISGFNLSLFFNIMGVSLLFGVANVNGTTELATKKMLAYTGGRRRIIPIVFWIIGFILAAAGAGTIPVLIVLMPLCAAIAIQEKIDYTLACFMGIMGTFAGGLSPISATGIIGINVSASVGVDVGNYLFYKFAIADLIVSAIIYIALKGWKLERIPKSSTEHVTKKFTSVQLLTLTVIAAFCIAVIGFNYDIPSCTFLGTAILLVFRAADEKAVMNAVPWSTLILLSGMGILVKMISLAGGITLLTNSVKGFLTANDAAPILCFMAGLMSTVSSGSGVVMPTLIPTVPELAAAANISPLPLIASITLGAHLAAISPFSTGGAIMLSMGGDKIDTPKVFNQMIIWAGLSLVIGCILAFVGVLG